MIEPIYTEEYRGYRIKIVPDDDLIDPREDENIGTMVCWHSRYNLGDKQPKDDPETWLQTLLGIESENDFTLPIDKLLERASRHYIFLPLYLYDHSGISMSTSTFVGHAQHAEWDSGQVGWIYVSKKDAVKVWNAKRFTKAISLSTINALVNEVKSYDDYLRGDIFGFQVCTADEDEEILDSVWGYYPDHGILPHYYSAMCDAKRSVDYEVKLQLQLKHEALPMPALEAVYE